MSDIHVSALYVYPVKSCAGIRYDHVALDERGLRHDRRWMVVDANGKFITQREFPKMSLAATALGDDAMTLTAPGLPALDVPYAYPGGTVRDVVVWRDTCPAVDEGEAAAKWFSELLGTEARLVRMAEDYERVTSTEYTPIPGIVDFADGYPLLFISEASLTDLNERMQARGKAPVLMNRFRPNIVLAGCEPYAEDTWRQVTIAGIQFDIVKPCARCPITTVDQAAGVIPDVKEPLATLATYRRGKNGGAMFGQNVMHRGTGMLTAGDRVQVHELAESLIGK